SGWDAQPAWSPDGTKITFASVRAGSAYQNIYTMNTDGSDVTRLTDSSTHNWDPDWQFVAVGNATPVVGPITASTDPVAVNTSVAASASFTDADAADIHTATWDWGDGTTSAGAITESNVSGSVSGSHTYTAAGVYTLGLTVTDDVGGIDSETFQYVVVYDPDAGFVTGCGWINSPAGAYSADPTRSGEASFGFVSRYQKGATTPSGRTQFRFRAGNLDFDSTSYEWLVISGAKAQYKGEGTINGTGDYGFLLTANDGEVSGGGDVDRFRIKIWEKATDEVVYDNQMGEAEDASASTAIDGGNIVIHK
ncbi:MAG: PKD domain-containing protein, partial [Chloroflexota bacterium]|nr:PKD domain-containing protein [Chloroflexota bacterium]